MYPDKAQRGDPGRGDDPADSNRADKAGNQLYDPVSDGVLQVDPAATSAAVVTAGL